MPPSVNLLCNRNYKSQLKPHHQSSPPVCEMFSHFQHVVSLLVTILLASSALADRLFFDNDSHLDRVITFFPETRHGSNLTFENPGPIFFGAGANLTVDLTNLGPEGYPEIGVYSPSSVPLLQDASGALRLSSPQKLCSSSYSKIYSLSSGKHLYSTILTLLFFRLERNCQSSFPPPRSHIPSPSWRLHLLPPARQG